jgi:hypothetical protein
MLELSRAETNFTVWCRIGVNILPSGSTTRRAWNNVACVTRARSDNSQLYNWLIFIEVIYLQVARVEHLPSNPILLSVSWQSWSVWGNRFIAHIWPLRLHTCWCTSNWHDSPHFRESKHPVGNCTITEKLLRLCSFKLVYRINIIDYLILSKPLI